MADFASVIAKKEARKAKRAENAAFQLSVKAARMALNGSRMPYKARKGRKAVPARKRAFERLESACRTFVLLRAKRRSAGLCEIAIACGGVEFGTVWYHAWPQKGGNGLKYDVRSQFASCSKCNMGEFGARYRGNKTYENRHKQLLGEALYAELNALHGRRQISTVEANEMADEIERKISNGDWR